MYTIMNYLSFVSMFCLSSAKIIHYADEYLNKAPVIDLTLSGSETILYVRLCEWSTMDGTFTILNMTRYCYCRKSCRFDPDNNSCSVPGPTLLMHDNTIINVTIVNELFGVPQIFGDDYNNMFRDIDITNLHVCILIIILCYLNNCILCYLLYIILYINRFMVYMYHQKLMMY